MNTLNNSVIAYFGKVLADADKDTIQNQYLKGLKMLQKDYHKALSNIENAISFCRLNHYDVAEKAYEICNLCRAVCDIIEGKATGYMAKLDAKQDGIVHQTMISRCIDSMRTMGIDNNTNKDLYIQFKDCTPAKWTRKQIKKVVIPRFYDSEGGIVKKIGKANAQKFFQKYSELLPKPDQMRQAFRDCWDNKATEYNWCTPDHCEVKVVVPEVFSTSVLAEEGWTKMRNPDAESTLIEWKNSKGVRKSCYCYYPKAGPRVAGEDDETKSLGANLIQSMDAYDMREAILRCAHANSYRAKFSTLKAGKTITGCTSAEEERLVANLYKCWLDTGICSLRVLSVISDNVVIPSDYYTAIAENITHLPNHEFKVVAVHDEFMCHLNYIDEMKQVFNYLKLEEYKGHLLQYWSRLFNWDKYGLSIEIDDINPEIVKAIIHSDYLLQ